MHTKTNLVGGDTRAPKETIADANVFAEVTANLDTGAVHMTFELADEKTPTLRARVVFECPDLGEAENFAWRILDAVAEIHRAHTMVATQKTEG
jgi:hypothetical protein